MKKSAVLVCFALLLVLAVSFVSANLLSWNIDTTDGVQQTDNDDLADSGLSKTISCSENQVPIGLIVRGDNFYPQGSLNDASDGVTLVCAPYSIQSGRLVIDRENEKIRVNEDINAVTGGLFRPECDSYEVMIGLTYKDGYEEKCKCFGFGIFKETFRGCGDGVFQRYCDCLFGTGSYCLYYKDWVDSYIPICAKIDFVTGEVDYENQRVWGVVDEEQTHADLSDNIREHAHENEDILPSVLCSEGYIPFKIKTADISGGDASDGAQVYCGKLNKEYVEAICKIEPETKNINVNEMTQFLITCYDDEGNLIDCPPVSSIEDRRDLFEIDTNILSYVSSENGNSVPLNCTLNVTGRATGSSQINVTFPSEYNFANCSAKVYVGTSFDENLVVYLPLNGSTTEDRRFDEQKIFNDWSGKGNDGICYYPGTEDFCPVFAEGHTGISEGAVKFDGANDYINITGLGKFWPLKASVMAWVKYNPAENTGNRIIYAKSNDFDNVDGLELFVYEKYVLCGYGAGSSIKEKIAFELSEADTKSWNHVACVSDDESVKLYINGKLERSGVKNSELYYNFTNKETPGLGGKASYYFTGLIEDFRFYNKALTADDIKNLIGEIITPAELCGEGETLCIKPDQTTFCDDSCTGIKCNNNDVCEVKEGCQCADCHGYKDSCAENLVCSFKTDTCEQCPKDTEFDEEKEICVPDSDVAVEILSPEDFQKFEINKVIDFNASIESLKKDINLSWSFADGNVTIISNCLTTGNCNITHSYKNSGAYVVRAKAFEQGGVEEGSDYVNVLVYKEGINVFAIISNPPAGSDISTEASKVDIYFNANKSYVANCTKIQSECTASASAEKGSSCYGVGSLYCYEFNQSKIGETYELKFDWVFDALKPQYKRELSGIWSENYSYAVEFNRSFFSLGRHTADLTVTYGYYA